MNRPDESIQPKRKINRTPLIVVISLVVLSSIGLFVVCFLSVAVPYLAPVRYKTRFEAALNSWDSNRPLSERAIQESIAEAERKNAGIATLLNMRRRYAVRLYWDYDYKAGDREMEKAIALVKGDPDPSYADELACCYQDRAWQSEHEQYMKDRSLPAGDKDQEKSLAICDKFMPGTAPVAYKLATLSTIYADMGEKANADKAMQRAIDLVTNSPEAKDAAVNVWSRVARNRALMHDYKGAAEAFFKARQLIGQDQDEKKQLLKDLTTGIRQSNRGSADSPEAVSALKLAKAHDFAKLESLAAKLQAEKSERANGYWKLDNILDQMSAECRNDQQYRARLALLQEWKKKFPRSAKPRVAIAALMTDYAWLARGSGYSNTVTKEGWKLFEERISQARKELDDFKTIKADCPTCFIQYETVALAQGWDHEEHDQLLTDCHKLWPTYQAIDIQTVYYLQPRWHGKEHEWEQFANKRCDEIGGKSGDMLYARMVWHVEDLFDNVFAEAPGIKWERVKRGFKSIIAEFPKDQSASSIFFKLADQANDEQCMKEALASLQNTAK